MNKRPTEHTPEYTIIDGPRAVAPINATPGLYMQVQRSKNTSMASILPQLQARARQHGYNPEGAHKIGFSQAVGADAYTTTIWFYDPLRY